jgi:uncharacterized lipoprotein NlpE involved in copper resistance
MKKLIVLLIMAVMTVGLVGCIDDQDNSGGKLPAKDIPK